ncbi:ROK family transcriptional regulator [Bacillus sp. 165]|uniref:ROK family transcriptional regulator n=1 Tax=Bacillus sp. 165 TaxID=1529117 RepID=UPI001ADC763B|nr:ROK family transcriptional regulator [Bacillus sp. 165]MBO9128982.1 ROK family transcriptional regulator [Bacillus sp. 165]
MSKGASVLRENNIRRILSFLRNNERTSRLDISNELGINKNTVSIIMEKFIQAGIVREMGIQEIGAAGRPKVYLSLVPGVYKSAGIFLKKNTIEYAVTDYRTCLLDKGEVSCETINVNGSLAMLSAVCKKLLQAHPEIIGFGIALPGIVNQHSGVLQYAASLGWNNVPIRDAASKEVSVPVHIINKVKAAALLPNEEIVQTAGLSTFYMSIGESVGGALIIDKHAYDGDTCTAGEIGHFVVKKEGDLCNCGQRGCLETLVNSERMREQLEQLLQETGRNMKEQLEYDMFRTAGYYTGSSLAKVVNLVNPSFLIIDSPYKGIRAFEEGVLDTLENETLHFAFQQLKVLFVKTDSAFTKGAAFASILSFESTYTLNKF